MLTKRMTGCVAVLCWLGLSFPALAAGDPDPDFAQGDGYLRMPLAVGEDADSMLANAIVDASGRLVAVGYRAHHGPGGSVDMVVTRVLDDGSPDPDFGMAGTVVVPFDVGGGKNDYGVGVFETANGRIVACGSSEGVGDAGVVAVVRLLPGGARDTSFDLDGRRVVSLRYPGASADTVAQASGCTAAADGRILVVATLYSEGYAAAGIVLLRLNEDGSADASFGEDGLVLFNPLSDDVPAAISSALLVQPDGRILVGGAARPGGPVFQFDMFVARLLADGSLDPSFGEDGVRAVAFDQGGDDYDLGYDIALDRDGRIVLAGTVSTASGGTDMGVARLRADGSLDPAFGTGGRALFGFDLGGDLDDVARTVAVDRTGRVYLGGEVRVGEEEPRLAVLRVLPSGILDTSFAAGGVQLAALPSPPYSRASARGLALDGKERVVAVGEGGLDGAMHFDAVLVRLTSEQLFHDGFEPAP